MSKLLIKPFLLCLGLSILTPQPLQAGWKDTAGKWLSWILLANTAWFNADNVYSLYKKYQALPEFRGDLRTHYTDLALGLASMAAAGAMVYINMQAEKRASTQRRPPENSTAPEDLTDTQPGLPTAFPPPSAPPPEDQVY